MENRSLPYRKSILALLRKDFLEEFRTRYAISALLMFALTSLVVVSFSVGGAILDPELHAAFIWIIIFFTAMSGIGRSFIKEEEKSTAMALRLSACWTIIFWGKLLFNAILILAVTVFVLALYLILMAPQVANLLLLLAVVILGSICLACATTIISAIVAKAANQGVLLPVLSLPVLLPLLMMVVNATQLALAQPGFDGAMGSLLFLLSYGVIIVTVSLLLFEFVWED